MTLFRIPALFFCAWLASFWHTWSVLRLRAAFDRVSDRPVLLPYLSAVFAVAELASISLYSMNKGQQLTQVGFALVLSVVLQYGVLFGFLSRRLAILGLAISVTFNTLDILLYLVGVPAFGWAFLASVLVLGLAAVQDLLRPLQSTHG